MTEIEAESYEDDDADDEPDEGDRSADEGSSLIDGVKSVVDGVAGHLQALPDAVRRFMEWPAGSDIADVSVRDALKGTWDGIGGPLIDGAGSMTGHELPPGVSDVMKDLIDRGLELREPLVGEAEQLASKGVDELARLAEENRASGLAALDSMGHSPSYIDGELARIADELGWGEGSPPKGQWWHF